MSGRIPQEFFDDLLGRVDIVSVIERRVPLRRMGREYAACCPFHAERTPSFSVSPQKQFYHCFGCHAHGNAIGFLMAHDGLEFLDAVAELAQQVGLEVPTTGGAADPLKPTLLALSEQADRFFQQQLRTHPEKQRAVAYLQQRGVTGQIAKAFGLGYAPPGRDTLAQALRSAGAVPDHLVEAGLCKRDERGALLDRFYDRVTFPIRDTRGRVIGFGGRALQADVVPKYLNSPETPIFHKGNSLYGLHEAKKRSPSLSHLIVVEGYMDVIALAQHNIPEAVATLGTAVTPEQIDRLFRMVSDAVFCFDGDNAGQAAMWKALQTALPLLSSGRQVRFLVLPEGDPDSYLRQEGATAFRERLAHATPLIDFLFAELSKQTDTQTVAGRARLIELARPLIARLPDGDLRDVVMQKFAQEGLAVTGLRPPAHTTQGTRAEQYLQLARTPLRQAIALLLYRPTLVQEMRDEDFQSHAGDAFGEQVFLAVATALRDRPNLTVGALLERYRDTREGKVLERLAAWTPPVPDEAYNFDEFKDILALFRRRHDPKEGLADLLLRYGPISGWSDAVREEIRNLTKPTGV